MRIQKYMSETGCCSRRETVRLITAGRITINGIKAQHESLVNQHDIILLDGIPIRKKLKNIYLILNKPIGITCTAQRLVDGNIITFLNYPERVFPIGRLDKQSEGLMIMTNDGDIVNKMMREENNHQKEYIVTVDRPYSDMFIHAMAGGVPILNQITKGCHVERVSEDTFRIILTQGLNRQIRRMAKYFGFNVVKLKRVRIMNLSLAGLESGEWREFTEEELRQLQELLT